VELFIKIVDAFISKYKISVLFDIAFFKRYTVNIMGLVIMSAVIVKREKILVVIVVKTFSRMHVVRDDFRF
jgi:hypothetical protein